MFNRKVLLIALLAVVLLGSFMDGRVSADRAYKRKRRASEPVAGGIAGTDLNFHRASLTNLMNQVTGIAAADPNNAQASFRDRKRGRKSKVSLDSGDLNQVISAAAADSNNRQLSFRDGRKHRRTKA